MAGVQAEEVAVLMAGPTAAGKSALALALAQALAPRRPVMLVNADSLQVYRDLKILSARPDAKALAAVPHSLYGHVPARQAYSVARWLEELKGVLAESWAAGRLPVLVGGTGLYFRAAEQGLAEVPAIPEAIRQEVRSLARRGGAAALKDQLSRLRALPAPLPDDPQRLARALEVRLATGRAMEAFLAEQPPGPLAGRVLTRCVVDLPRAKLYARVDARFDQMMALGALEEVRGLLAKGVPADRPAMKALGVPQLADHLAGRLSLETAVGLAKQASRRYAKRQLTWARNQMADWPRLPAGSGAQDRLIALVNEALA